MPMHLVTRNSKSLMLNSGVGEWGNGGRTITVQNGRQLIFVVPSTYHGLIWRRMEIELETNPCYRFTFVLLFTPIIFSVVSGSRQWSRRYRDSSGTSCPHTGPASPHSNICPGVVRLLQPAPHTDTSFSRIAIVYTGARSQCCASCCFWQVYNDV